MTIQVIALLAIVGLFAWLTSNTIQNLSDLGKDFSFDFLFNRAGYDINQTLISYSSDSTHGRAALVGILNTLLVAVIGCALATVIGVTVGVLRLSQNWIVARLATVYVETFRNVPVLLWILLFFAILTEMTPEPKAFRGDNPTASMWLWDSVAVTNRGIYIPRPVFDQGSLALIAVFLLSLVAVWFLRRNARQRQEQTGEILPVGWLSLGIIVVPVLIAFILLGKPISLELPVLKGFNFTGGVNLQKAFIAILLALSFYTGSFIAENVRAGILAVSRGQTEAAYALGLRPGRTTRLVVLPQALRVIIPPLISQYLNLTKNSSLAIAIGYMDVRATLGGITMNQTGRELECVLLMMGFYLVISISVSLFMNWYNARVALKER
jgi:general L-amino acid transport system permease protein